MFERIGGHRGLDVLRGDGVISKIPLHERGVQGDDLHGVDLYGLNETAIHNEAFMLDVMSGSGVTPNFISLDDGELLQTDVGKTERPKDAEHWRHNLVKALATIRARGLRHGDLKGPNVITRNDYPWIIDWQEGHFLGDVPPQVRPKSDSYFLMQHIEMSPGEDGLCDIPRVARRWRAVLESLGAVEDVGLPLKGKTFLDVGCFQGDFVALAAAEGMWSKGIDNGRFRSGENSIEIGRSIWSGFPYGNFQLAQVDAAGFHDYFHDVVMMFSTWPYIVADYGYPFATDLLRRIVEQSGVFFFETQYSGDGPGPHFLNNDEDVKGLFITLGAGTVEPIASFSVTNRPWERTIWRIEK